MGSAISTEEDEELDSTVPWQLDEATQLRWALDVEAWRPTASEWQFLLATLPRQEQEEAQRFRSLVDRKRALMSRLLQRRCVAAALAADATALVFGRTKGTVSYTHLTLPTILLV